MSSGIELAKAIPDIEQPLTYHLLSPVSDGLLREMTSEEISSHSSYQLENIPESRKFTSDLNNVRLQDSVSICPV